MCSICDLPPSVCSDPNCCECFPNRPVDEDGIAGNSVQARVARERQRVRDLRALGISAERPRRRVGLRALLAALFR